MSSKNDSRSRIPRRAQQVRLLEVVDVDPDVVEGRRVALALEEVQLEIPERSTEPGIRSCRSDRLHPEDLDVEANGLLEFRA